MGAVNDMDARHGEIHAPVRHLVQILRLIRQRFANAAPTKMPSNKSRFGIVR